VAVVKAKHKTLVLADLVDASDRKKKKKSAKNNKAN